MRFRCNNNLESICVSEAHLAEMSINDSINPFKHSFRCHWHDAFWSPRPPRRLNVGGERIHRSWISRTFCTTWHHNVVDTVSYSNCFYKHPHSATITILLLPEHTVQRKFRYSYAISNELHILHTRTRTRTLPLVFAHDGACGWHLVVPKNHGLQCEQHDGNVGSYPISRPWPWLFPFISMAVASSFSSFELVFLFYSSLQQIDHFVSSVFICSCIM